eukprot:4567426-Pyramimonas_sp.AAC.1
MQKRLREEVRAPHSHKAPNLRALSKKGLLALDKPFYHWSNQPPPICLPPQEDADPLLTSSRPPLEQEMRILRGETAADDSNIDFEMSDEEVAIKPRRKKKAGKGKKKGGRN